MKSIRFWLVPFGVALVLFLGGCSSTALQLDKHGDQVGEFLEISTKDLVFISEGEVANTETFTDYFKPRDAGVIALTEDALIWRHGSRTSNAGDDKVHRVALADISLMTNDRGSLQLHTEEDVYLVRIRGWQRYAADGERQQEFETQILGLNNKIRIVAGERTYQKATGNRRLGQDTITADRQSSPEESARFDHYTPPDQFAHKYGR